MAKKLNSYSSLTEFAPLSPDSKPELFSIRQMFRKNKEKPSSHAKNTDPSEDDDIKNVNLQQEFLSFGAEKSVGTPQMDKNRGMSGILSKIMNNIVDKKKKGLQNYKDSDFKQYWMLDSNCKECYDCGDKFTAFRRRHHCRVCGQIFCRRCCNQEISGDLIGYTDNLRVCSYCCKTVLSCVRSLDYGTHIEDDSNLLYPIQTSFNMDLPAGCVMDSQSNPVIATRRRSSVIGFREEDIAKAKTIKSLMPSITSPGQSSNKSDGFVQVLSLRHPYISILDFNFSRTCHEIFNYFVNCYILCIYLANIISYTNNITFLFKSY